jgi:MFS family permease
MGLRRYRDLLRTPGLAPLMLAVSFGRLPYGMNILAVILLLRAAGFDYAEVGIVTAASGLSVGLAAPVMGRMIDRVGQTKVLLTAAAFTVLSGTAFVVAVLEGAGATPVTILAFLTGLIVPPVSPSLRALLPGLVGRERLDTAFALDALLLELAFIFGPLLAAGIATAISPEVAFLTGVALQAAGGLGVAASPHSRAWRPEPREPGVRRKGALAGAGIRVLVLTLALTAVGLGVLEIAIAAFAEEHATRDDAGWLFALWSAGSLAGGLWYGAREWRLPSHLRFLVVTGVLATGLAPLPLAGSMPVFAVLVIVAGLGLAPSTAAAYSLIGELAPAGAVTEAYSWQIVGYVAGSAVGAWLAGVIVEHAGVGAALACAPLATAVGLLLALARRRTLMAPARPSPRSAAPR